MQPRYGAGEQTRYPSDNGIIWVGEKGIIAAPYNRARTSSIEKQSKRLQAAGAVHPALAGTSRRVAGSDPRRPAAVVGFDYSGPLTEMVLLGNLAVRTGKKVEWDYKNMRVKNNRDAQQYVKREYRKGWEL